VRSFFSFLFTLTIMASVKKAYDRIYVVLFLLVLGLSRKYGQNWIDIGLLTTVAVQAPLFWNSHSKDYDTEPGYSWYSFLKRVDPKTKQLRWDKLMLFWVGANAQFLVRVVAWGEGPPLSVAYRVTTAICVLLIVTYPFIAYSLKELDLFRKDMRMLYLASLMEGTLQKEVGTPFLDLVPSYSNREEVQLALDHLIQSGKVEERDGLYWATDRISMPFLDYFPL
jgi:hypothetical protein